MHNALLVQVAEAANQAPQVVAYLRLRQRLPRLQHVGQGLPVTRSRSARTRETEMSSGILRWAK